MNICTIGGQSSRQHSQRVSGGEMWGQSIRQGLVTEMDLGLRFRIVSDLHRQKKESKNRGRHEHSDRQQQGGHRKVLQCSGRWWCTRGVAVMWGSPDVSRLISRKNHFKLLNWKRLLMHLDGGAWQAAVRGVAKSQTRQSHFTFTDTLVCWIDLLRQSLNKDTAQRHSGDRA